MKKILLIIACVLMYLKDCNGQHEKRNVWVIKKVTTNYVSKGPDDHFEIPRSGIIGTEVIIDKRTLIILNKSTEYLCEDTLIVSDSIVLETKSNSYTNFIYPGDELSCLDNNNIKDEKCYVSESFLSINGLKSKRSLKIFLFKTTTGTRSICKMFWAEHGRTLILFNPDNFLLYTLQKKPPLGVE